MEPVGSALPTEAEHFDPDPPTAGHELPEAEHWERFEEDPELEALEAHDQPGPYEPAHGPGGDPLMEDDPFLGPPNQPAPHRAGRPAAEPGPSEAEYPPAPAAPHLEQETEEYSLEDDPEADDDVLETTPEFLQDAPDHDRLWFEQRPPRDFDFDG